MILKAKKSTKKKTSKLRKTFEKVRILSLATPRVRKQLVQRNGREIVDCISECCVKILKGNVQLSPKQKSCLAKHKHKIREIAKKIQSATEKENYSMRRISFRSHFGTRCFRAPQLAVSLM